MKYYFPPSVYFTPLCRSKCLAALCTADLFGFPCARTLPVTPPLSSDPTSYIFFFFLNSCADFTQQHPLPPIAQGIHVGFGPSLAHANTLWQAKERITKDSRNLVAFEIWKGSGGVWRISRKVIILYSYYRCIAYFLKVGVILLFKVCVNPNKSGVGFYFKYIYIFFNFSQFWSAKYTNKCLIWSRTPCAQGGVLEIVCVFKTRNTLMSGSWEHTFFFLQIP